MQEGMLEEDGVLEASGVEDDSSSTVSSPGVGLCPLEVSAVVCVLEDCLDQLRILSFTEGKPQIQPDMRLLSLEDRFGKPTKKTDAVEWISKGLQPTNSQDSPFTKIQKDRGYAEKLVQQTLEELLEAGTFTLLEAAVSRASELRQEENQLLSDEIANTGYVNYLRRQLSEEMLQRTAQLTQKDEQIARLKDEIQSAVYHSELEQQYLHKWEAARSGQNSLRLERAERQLEERLDNLRAQLELETVVHDEKQNFLMQEQTNTEKKLEYWMAKYYEDTDAKADEINFMKEKRRLNLKHLEELQQMFQSQGEEVAEYVAVKEERERRRAHEERLSAAATHIQAWWRGTMVRRGLGPYKRRHPRDKGKAGKRGGKKK